MYVIHTIYMCVYKSFSTTLDKDLRKKTLKKRDGEIRKHKLNEMAALSMKKCNYVKDHHIVQLL